MLERIQFACNKVEFHKNVYKLKWRAKREADEIIYETTFDIEQAVLKNKSAYSEEINVTSLILHHLGMGHIRGAHTIKKTESKEYELTFSIKEYHLLEESLAPIINGTEPLPKPKSILMRFFCCCNQQNKKQKVHAINLQPLLYHR